MGAATVSDAEHDGLPVAGHLWHGSRIAGAARHHVAVERRREIHRITAGERDAHEMRVRGRPPFRVHGNGQDPGAVRRPGEGEGGRVGERDHPRIAHPVGCDDVNRRPEDEVAVRRRRSREDELLPVGRPGRLPGIPVAARHLAALPGLDLEDVQVQADAAPDPDAVGLVVEALGHEGIVAAPSPVVVTLPRRCEQVDGCGERDPRAVGAPDGPPGAEGQIGQRSWLAAPGRQEPDLRGTVTCAQEGDRGAVGAPRRRGVGRAARELLRVAVAAAHSPQRGDVPVGVRLARPQHVDDLLPVG